MMSAIKLVSALEIIFTFLEIVSILLFLSIEYSPNLDN